MTTFEVFHEPRRWSQVCGCFIPESWTAVVYEEDGSPMPKWPCGDTEDEARANVLREFPDAVED